MALSAKMISGYISDNTDTWKTLINVSGAGILHRLFIIGQYDTDQRGEIRITIDGQTWISGDIDDVIRDYKSPFMYLNSTSPFMRYLFVKKFGTTAEDNWTELEEGVIAALYDTIGDYYGFTWKANIPFKSSFKLEIRDTDISGPITEFSTRSIFFME